MKIILDAMQGPAVSRAAVLGAMEALQPELQILLVGDKAGITELLGCRATDPLPPGIEIAEAGPGVSPSDSVTDLLLNQTGGSLLTGLELLAQGRGDAFVTSLCLDSLLSGIPLKKEAMALLQQTADPGCPVRGAILIPSPETSARFVGRGLKQMLQENKALALKMLGSRIPLSQLLQLSRRRDLLQKLRSSKPVMLLPLRADTDTVRRALAHLAAASAGPRP